MLAGASSPRPVNRLDPPNALGNIYRTADDRWLLLAFANENKEVPLFLKAIGHPEAADRPAIRGLREPPRACGRDRRVAGQGVRHPVPGRVARAFAAASLTYGVVQTLDEAAHDPQFFANGVFVPIEDGSSEPRLTIDSPVRLDQEKKVRPRRAPEIGEHTQAVLSELGFDAAAINELQSAGAIPKK